MFKIPNFFPEALFDTEDERDVTSLALPLGVLLPDGYTIRARMTNDDDQDDPRNKGDVYNTDVDEDDYSIVTRAFCGHCGKWVKKLTGHDVAAILAEDRDAGVESGDWAADNVVSCPENDVHEPDAPLAVRDFYEGKWRFVGVMVDVLDPDGNEIGSAALWGTEAGSFPYKIDRDTGAVEYKTVMPLDESYPMHDLIREAADEAAEALERAARREMGPGRRALARLARCVGVTVSETDPDAPRIVVGSGPQSNYAGDMVWSAQVHHKPALRDGVGDAPERRCDACGEALPPDLPVTDPCRGPRRAWWGRRR